MKSSVVAVSLALLCALAAGGAGAYVALQRGEYAVLRTPGPAEVSAPLAGSGMPGAPAAVVRMTPQGYLPQSVQVRRGDIVEFQNVGVADQWPDAPGGLGARGVVPAGRFWRVALPDLGTFKFTDRVYPHVGATVEVR